MKKENPLREALRRLEIEEAAAVAPDEKWIPSREYRERVAKLTRKAKNPMWKFVNTAGKKAVAATLAVLIVFSSLMSVRAFRESVVGFVLDVFEKGTKIELTFDRSQDPPHEIKTKYLPAYLPAGFDRAAVDSDTWAVYQIEYRNSNDEFIYFEQGTLWAAHVVDTEGTALKDTAVQGKEAYYFSNKGHTYLIWANEEYCFFLLGPERLEIAEYLQIAESVEEKGASVPPKETGTDVPQTEPGGSTVTPPVKQPETDEPVIAPDYLTYTIENGEATVASCSKDAAGAVVIPAVWEGCPVTAIAPSAFSGCAGVTSVTLPEGVKSVGSLAFSGCTDLLSFAFPASVAEIGPYPLHGCESLTRIEVSPDNPKYAAAGNCVFEKETKTLLFGCSSSVIPDDGSVTAISQRAFNGCAGLASVTIPPAVTRIDAYAFNGCTGLTSLTLPDRMTVDRTAFNKCSSVTSVTLTASLGTVEGLSFSVFPNLKTVTVGDGVTAIGEGVFAGCSRLTSVILPESLRSIGRKAFGNCKALKSLLLPDSLESVGDDAFRDSPGLVGTTFDNAVYLGSAGNPYFLLLKAVDTSIRTCAIHENTRMIGPGAFADCRELERIELPQGLTAIGGRAFYACRAIPSVVLPSGLKSVGEAAFFGCWKLTEAKIPEGIESLGTSLFDGCSNLETIEWPQDQTRIPGLMFRGCYSLVSVTLGKNVSKIGSNAFNGCSALKTVVFSGTEAEWNAVAIEEWNDPIRNAEIRFAADAGTDPDPA